jgi:hypothetical protein
VRTLVSIALNSLTLHYLAQLARAGRVVAFPPLDRDRVGDSNSDSETGLDIRMAKRNEMLHILR